jgi:hypothetical protein
MTKFISLYSQLRENLKEYEDRVKEFDTNEFHERLSNVSPEHESVFLKKVADAYVARDLLYVHEKIQKALKSGADSKDAYARVAEAAFNECEDNLRFYIEKIRKYSGNDRAEVEEWNDDKWKWEVHEVIVITDKFYALSELVEDSEVSTIEKLEMFYKHFNLSELTTIGW